MINDIRRCFIHKSIYDQAMIHLELLILHCDYNGFEDITIFSKGDEYIDQYFTHLLWIPGILPDLSIDV